MANSHPDLSHETLRKFLLIHRHLRRYSRQISSQGIGPRGLSVLRFLLEHGPATVGEVQDYLMHSASTASTVISQLEDGGYVKRTRSKEDNRVVFVSLTPEGESFAQNTPLGGILLLRQRLRTLPDDRLRAIDAALGELMQLMEVTEDE